MKNTLTLFLALFSIILFSCEGVIYHNFEVENNTNDVIVVEFSINNSDSIISRYILQDSAMIIYSTDEMQGFFSNKVFSRSISDVFDKLEIVKDLSYSNLDCLNDSIWIIDYEPGVYTYKLEVNLQDF